MNALFCTYARVGLVLAASLAVVSTEMRAQEPPVKTTIAQDLVATFGLCYDQRVCFTQFRQMYPELESHVMIAEMRWNIAFKAAEEGVEARLKVLFPDRWADSRAKLIA
jgi:hypothetical protein